MNNLPQQAEQEAKVRKTAYLAEDVWEAVRKEAFETHESMTAIIDDALRSYFKLPAQKEAH